MRRIGGGHALGRGAGAVLLGDVGPLAVGAHFHGDLHAGQFRRQGADQLVREQLVLHRAVRQKGHAMAFKRHGFEAFGHVGLVNPVQVNGHRRALQNQIHHLAQVRAFGIRQVRQRLTRFARQLEQRRAVGIRLGVGRHHFLAQADHVKAV